MKRINKNKIESTTELFNEKITDIAAKSMMTLTMPLLVYVIFFNIDIAPIHPISLFSNYLLFGIFVIIIPTYKKLPYRLKRILLFGILFYYGLETMSFGDLEFMTIILILLVSFTLLTSSVKTSGVILGVTLLLYILFPILTYFNILSFYYDPFTYHYNIHEVIKRVAEAFVGITFMASIILYVFRNNQNNISQLKKQVAESIELNRRLLSEVGERKKAQVLAADHANSFITLFNNSYDGFMILSKDYTILDTNQSILNISGFKRGEIIGCNIIDFIGEGYKAVIEERKHKLIQGEKLPDLLVDTHSKDGNRLVMQAQVVLINKDDNFKYLSVLKDVTEETIATEELSKREQLYKALFNQTNDSILIVNDNTIVEHNNIAEKLYPCLTVNSHACIPYVNLNDKFDEPNATVNLEQRIKMALTGDVQSFEWIHDCCEKKSIVYTLVSIIALKELGPQCYMVVEKDIMDRKKGQNLILNSIIQTEENERKRISSDLHDGIGPILTTVKLYTQALLDSKTEEKKQEISDKLINIVEDAIGSISEISLNISPQILINYGIVTAVESFIEKFNLSEKLNIKFRYGDIGRFDENKEITIYRLFSELINNTIKHAEATNVLFEIKETSKEVELFYTDDGIGFNPEQISSDSIGMGLGNFKSRIQSFNGQFVLKSQPGNGIEVKIKLPKTETV